MTDLFGRDPAPMLPLVFPQEELEGLPAIRATIDQVLAMTVARGDESQAPGGA